jgi:hypothetical protein
LEKKKGGFIMNINHKHPIYENESNKLNVLQKRFTRVYGALIEKRTLNAKSTKDIGNEVLL